jgi:type I restriction enzyme S subunit
MELTKIGFKKTEIGLIPEDWDVKQIGSISNSFSGGTPNTTVREYYQGKIPWISSSELNQGLIKRTKGFISQKGLESSSAKMVNEETFLLAMYGATAGVSAITKIDGAINQAVLAIESASVLPYYLYSYFQLRKDDIIKTYTQGGQPNLSGNIVKSIKIPLPPTLTEQKAIATALSDVDSLISSLDKLISKKKAIKQGAMQALLKGKKRLKGFNDHSEMKDSEFGPIPTDWEVKLLPEVFDYIHGKAHEQFISSDGNYKVVNSKFVSTEGKVVKNSSVNFCPAKKGDILTVLSDLPNGKALAKTFLVEENDVFAVNQRVCIWRTKKDSSLFLNYVMNRNKYFLKLDDGVTQTHILNNHIEKCPVLLPKSIEEQSAIGECLKAMDLEIESLENKKAKYEEIKQGMMQELLTGKTRLV